MRASDIKLRRGIYYPQEVVDIVKEVRQLTAVKPTIQRAKKGFNSTLHRMKTSVGPIDLDLIALTATRIYNIQKEALDVLEICENSSGISEEMVDEFTETRDLILAEIPLIMEVYKECDKYFGETEPRTRKVSTTGNMPRDDYSFLQMSGEQYLAYLRGEKVEENDDDDQ